MANYGDLRLALGDLLDQLELHGSFMDRITNHNFWDAYTSAKEAWEKSGEGQVIYVASIDYGPSCEVYAAYTENELRDRIHQFVVEWWTGEIGDTGIPVDRDQAIDLYFKTLAKEVLCMGEAEIG